MQHYRPYNMGIHDLLVFVCKLQVWAPSIVPIKIDGIHFGLKSWNTHLSTAILLKKQLRRVSICSRHVAYTGCEVSNVIGGHKLLSRFG